MTLSEDQVTDTKVLQIAKTCFEKCFDMFQLLENSIIAYYGSLSLSTLLLTIQSSEFDSIALDILKIRVLPILSELKEDDPEDYIEKLFLSSHVLIISL